jgi:hypothetical protein
MSAVTAKHPLATLAVVVGLLVAAAPAGAGICAFPDVCTPSRQGVVS